MNESTQLALGIDKFHRNEYLFSDHYLDSILRRDPAWDAAQGPAAGFLNWLREHYAAEGDQLAAYNEAQLEENWIKPILGRLGHVWEPQASVPGLDKTIKKPDYVFFPDDDTRKAAVAEQRTEEYTRRALAMGEVKAWPVSLSHKTAGAPTFANNNPMFQIDYYLKATGAAWGIAANGRFWRLVHKDSSYRLDRYFEIDLLAALNAPDERRALAVATWFTLFFGRAAFMPDETGRVFLDDVLKGSRTYAVALESDLRDNAYKALEQLILGFFAPAANGLSPDDEADRAAVYRNSLLLLYRLLFLFFGESRGLLPMDNPAYADRSLTALAKRAARAVDDHKVDGLPATTGGYWADFKDLFTIIDGRDAALNAFLGVPRYNGGLFDPQRHAFLENNYVGERHLMRAIDYLARRRKTENGRFAGYESVDYRTLGVRQLGSIYEGLLEYKVSVAAEEMVTVRKGGKETWLPARERGKTKVIETKQPGELYLSTDKGERKATGSYYTPDYIVKYIVEQTLGPLVEEARRKIRNTKYEIRDAARLFEQEILSLNVLDPAMGSGHFLVDATNYLARALATAELTADDRRPAADNALSGGQPSAVGGQSEESDLTYWKRRVVEACIYGVDKNELAVELAKLSLWLETVAADKPLSFLDHHLRHGDSLIGARLADLERAPGAAKGRKGEREKGGKGAEPLFDESAFTTSAGLAVGGMAAIEARPTDDLDTVHAKEEAFHIIHDTHLGRWRRLADLWTSAWFGNAMSAEEYRDLALRIQGKPGGLMSDEQAARYLNHPAAVDNDYFHWELEFPEVFFDVYGRPKGEKAGFDAVVGNPPYVPTEQISEIDKAYFSARFRSLYRKYDLSVAFLERGFDLIKSKGFVAMITPVAWETGENYELFREIHLNGENSTLLSIINLPFDVFPEAYVDTNIAVFRAIQCEGNFAAREFGKYEKVPDRNNLLYDAEDIPLDFIIQEPGKKIYFSRIYYEMLARFRNEHFVNLGGLTDACQGIVESFYEYSPSKVNEDYLPYYVCTADRYQINVEEQSFIDFGLTNSLYKYYTQPRILFRRLVNRQDRLMAIFVKNPFVVRKDLNPFIMTDSSGYDLLYLLACLNSKLHSYLYIKSSALAQKDDFRQTTLAELRRLPIAVITFQTKEADRKGIVNSNQLIWKDGHYDDVVGWATYELTANRTDTIHDFLSYLAQQMIALHQEKQTLTADFWTDLEGVTTPAAFRKLRDKGKQEAGLAADPALAPFVRAESKSTRTLDESLAWDEAAFKGFVRALAGPVDNLSRLLRVYHTHAPRARDLTDRITRTDTLIDQIVYKLYGLTDEEIAIVEGG